MKTPASFLQTGAGPTCLVPCQLAKASRRGWGVGAVGRHRRTRAGPSRELLFNKRGSTAFPAGLRQLGSPEAAVIEKQGWNGLPLSTEPGWTINRPDNDKYRHLLWASKPGTHQRIYQAYGCGAGGIKMREDLYFKRTCTSRVSKRFQMCSLHTPLCPQRGGREGNSLSTRPGKGDSERKMLCVTPTARGAKHPTDRSPRCSQDQRT